MKNAKIKNRQKLSMLVVTMVLVLLMTLIAGMFTGCGKMQTEAQMEQKATARVATAAQEAAKEDLLNQK